MRALAAIQVISLSLQKAQVTGRPVTELAKWVASLLSGDDPRLLHIAAIALHTLAALLVAAVLRQTQTEWIVSAMASLLFQRVVAIDPDYAPARQNLAAVAKSVTAP